MLINQISLKDLKKKYVYANTPKYLYHHFQSNASLHLLAIKNDPECLVQEYNRVISRETLSLEDTVTAYAILIAISFLEYKKAVSLYARLDLTKLKWGEEIQSIYIANEKNWHFTTLHIDAHPSTQVMAESTGSTNTVSLDIPDIQRG